MEVCKTCCSLIRQIGQDKEESGDIRIRLPRLPVKHTPHCWICYKFSQWLRINDQNKFRAWCHRSLRVKISCFLRSVYRDHQQNVILPLLFGVDIRPSNYKKSGSGCFVQLSFVLASDFSRSRRYSLNVGTIIGRDISAVDAWVSNCTNHHSKCCQKIENWYPTRLIQLACAGQKARLVLSKTSHPRGNYVTLSHRWIDKSHPISKSHPILRSDTLQKFQESIDIVHLPQIFQEAIKITVDLGFCYLWIDRLCILQDDRSDWANESRNLEKIYSSAFMNISATMSSNGMESLFQRSPSPSYYPSRVKLLVNGKLENFFALDGGMWEDEIENAPLLQRAWVFPERYLARRVLHFGQHQMAWECRELATLQALPNGLPRTCTQSAMAKPQFEHIIHALSQNPVEEYDLKFARTWQNLVQQYSKCALTETQDKLIAFSGIAGRIQRYRNDCYVAGMWKSSLIYDLGWWRPIDMREAFPINKTSSRAASWSWASVDGEIEFPTSMDSAKFHFAIVKELANQITVESNVSSSRDFVRLQGHLLSLRLNWSLEEIYSFEVAHFRFVDNESPISSFIKFEIADEEVQVLDRQGRLVFLPLFATGSTIYGIALTEIHGTCAYRRIGALEIQAENDSISAETIASIFPEAIASGNSDQNELDDGVALLSFLTDLQTSQLIELW